MTVDIPVADTQVTGRLLGSGDLGILLAHGAGTTQDHPFMVMLREGLAGAGHTVLTFNYRYSDRGSRRPDPTETLLQTHRAAADYLAPRVGALFLAGRSMGGRIGSHLAADGYPTAGLVFYAYPLHPAGKPDRLRVDHLPGITVPMLFFQGTRDALSRMDLFSRHLATLANADVEILEGASHATKGGGWTEATMAARLVERTTAWVGSVSSGGTTTPRA
jgi:predicted alpha/beta-hydrolase family hydrolase